MAWYRNDIIGVWFKWIWVYMWTGASLLINLVDVLLQAKCTQPFLSASSSSSLWLSLNLWVTKRRKEAAKSVYVCVSFLRQNASRLPRAKGTWSCLSACIHLSASASIRTCDPVTFKRERKKNEPSHSPLINVAPACQGGWRWERCELMTRVSHLEQN